MRSGFLTTITWFFLGYCLINNGFVVAQSRFEKDNVKLNHKFPSLNDTLHMASLSYLVYQFVNDVEDDAAICARMNQPAWKHNMSSNTNAFMNDDNGDDSGHQNNSTKRRPIPHGFVVPSDFTCHWYYHDKEHEGTQLMIVSSVQDNYLAVVFAGTDDYQTSLRDMNLLQKPFGDYETEPQPNWTLPHVGDSTKVHAGFDHAVFRQGLMDQIWTRVEEARTRFRRPIRLYTTGHSLGAAAAMLTAAALTTRYREATHPPLVTTLNFGCPCVGNYDWREYVHAAHELDGWAVWRFVLGWDLVPRLPELFYHVGHTVQLTKGGRRSSSHVEGDNLPAFSYSEMLSEAEAPHDKPQKEKEDDRKVSRWWWWWWDDKNSTPKDFHGTADAYYQHYGDQKNYASVPLGWNSLPYIWVPGALDSHHAVRYWQFLYDFRQALATRPNKDDDNSVQWITEFVPFSPDNTDDHPPNVDDDFYVNPPDDGIS